MNLPDENSDYLSEWRGDALNLLEKAPDYLCITSIISLLCPTASFKEANRWKGLLLDACKRKTILYEGGNPHDDISWQLIKFHRDDVKQFIKRCYTWPLPEDVPLRSWFETSKTDPASKGKGAIQEKRKARLKKWLEDKKIPKDQWESLQGLSVREIYKELIKFPEFIADKPGHPGKPEPITYSTFYSRFWKKQKICFCPDKNNRK